MLPYVQTGPRCVQSAPKKKIRAHYERYFYSDPDRKFPIPTKHKTADLISTCLVKSRDESPIVYMLQVDLDFGKVRDASFITQEKISWEKVEIYLKKNHSYLLDHIFSATRSYGGRGLSIGISISPLVIGSSSEKAAKILLKKLHDLFELAGCGVDRGAFGLKRLCANWQNEKKSLYLNLDIKRETESKRPPVVSMLLKKLNTDPLLAYKRKKDQTDSFLWPHKKTEEGLSKLFLELLENNYTLQSTTKELKNLTSLSEPTLRSVLQKPPKWLLAKWLAKNEGWSLGLVLDHMDTFSKRAFSLVGDPSKKSLCPSETKAKSLPASMIMKHPEDVYKGERNAQITLWILTLKWFGIDLERAQNHILELSEKIADQSESRNLGESRIASKIKSIYGSLYYQNTFAIYPTHREFPEWLRPPGKASPTSPFEKTKKNLEAPLGGVAMANKLLAPKESVQRRISADGHFQWKVRNSKNQKGRKFTEFAYYSAPSYPGSDVLVFEKEGELHVFSKITGHLLCTHKKRKTPKVYSTDPLHVKNLSLNWFFNNIEGDYEMKIIKRWKEIYKLEGIRAYRGILREKRSFDQLKHKGAKK